MTVGALLDLGLPIERVREAVDVLGLEGVEVWAERTERSAIAAAKFQVRVHGQHPDASHGAAAHSRHGHRPWIAIRDLIAGSTLEAAVRERALAIFARLAEAEGLVHGGPAARGEFPARGAPA